MNLFKLCISLLLVFFYFSTASATTNKQIGLEELLRIFQNAEAEVPNIPLRQAFDYFYQHQNSIENKNYLSIVDFRQHSGEKRKYIIDMRDGSVVSYYVSHGRNSDTDHNGYATEFSNIPNSYQSSLGFYLVAETYYGRHGLSMRMDGLEESNNNARNRAIVIHGATYVSSDRDIMGRSLGCPAVEMHLVEEVVEKIAFGSLYYIYYNQNYFE